MLWKLHLTSYAIKTVESEEKEKSKPWYTDNIHGMRKLLRHNEKMSRNSGLEIHRQIISSSLWEHCSSLRDHRSSCLEHHNTLI